MNNKYIMQIENLSYQKVLTNLNMNIEKGKFIAVSGSNNSGKTTLIKLIGGLIPCEKMIIINDSYIETLNKNTLFNIEGIVLLNDKINFILNTVYDEIMLVLDNLNLDEKEKLSRYHAIVKLLNLKSYEKVNPNSLNRTNKIKVLLALAIIHKPQILLLDDLCLMMTKQEKDTILSILKLLNEKENMTIIMSTGNLEEVMFCDYLYILEKGKIVIQGKPLDILKDDNIINRLGLEIPFMFDLSVKLKDYDLLDDVILDMDGMVNTLWK